jgi:hypothetical protein
VDGRLARQTRHKPSPSKRQSLSDSTIKEDRQTVQFEGVAIDPEGTELERVQEAYFAVWPDGPARILWPNIAYFVVQPRWIRFSNFDQTPPLIVEMSFPA